MLTPAEEIRKSALLQEIKALEDSARARWIEEASAKEYKFSDIADPYRQEEIRRFQRVFGGYFPGLLESEHEVILEEDWLQCRIYGNPTETIKKSSIENELRKFRKAIQTLAEHPKGYCKNMIAISYWDSKDDKLGIKASEIFEFILLLDEVAEEGTLPQVLDRYERWAREAIASTPDRRNINWEAVHAVSRLRWFWWRRTGEDAPGRALNPASPFADYLRDAFEYFEIAADPISAFRRWAALAEKDETLR